MKHRANNLCRLELPPHWAWKPVRVKERFGIRALLRRIGLAWGVITWRYDVLDWEDRPALPPEETKP